MKVAVTGSSGFIGTALTASLRADGHQVLRLVRRSPRGPDEVRWDPRAADAGLSTGQPGAGLDRLAGLDGCVHLAAAGIGDRRWTRAYQAELRTSRILGTQTLAQALTRLDAPPKVLVSASAIGWYGGTGQETDEDGSPGTGFTATLAQDWEAAAEPARAAGIRVVHPRTGLVLGRGGGMLGRLLPLARFGVLPRLGTGTQMMSWISLTDAAGALAFLLGSDQLSGPVNLTTPEPVSNSDFTSAVNRQLHRPDPRWLRIPAPVLRLVIGKATQEFLSSSRVRPRRLTEAGYRFRYPDLAQALTAELRR